ncbi:hypothetical protein DFR24_4597 [Panacagrimonas perspica]|uniref:Uncharacterized protein n=1 Tax=Panacagrimonas perspica TaxID=381431 RepID=A0A4S3KA61_9GAMM|nr:hypothetical protein [Panacagrimonas perspica]TDU24330.1 hypothetical protein DFR24_4597 [Panacagrimonas perspica]THD04724.1 hypothetical protein B1810_04770 [Panacagrimonas perspica]
MPLLRRCGVFARCAFVSGSFWIVAPVAAADVAQYGGSFRLNATLPGDQRDVAIAVAPDGQFAAAWTGPDGGGLSTFVRFYDSVGKPRTREIRVSDAAVAEQTRPSLATTGNTYIVAWTTGEGTSTGVQARRLTFGGRLIDDAPFDVDARGPEFSVAHPSVACSIGGLCAIAYTLSSEEPDFVDALVRRIDPSTGTLDPEIRVSPQSARNRMAMLVQPDGALRLAWQQPGGEFNDRVMTANLASGASVPNAAVLVGRGSSPRIGGDQDGNFTLVFDLMTDEDETDRPIRARRYLANGTALGESFVVTTDSANRSPDVAVAADGDFLVVWQGVDRPEDEPGVFARRYRADGSPVAAPFVVRSPTTGSQLLPAVAMDPDGDAIVAWADDARDGAGRESGVYARRYRSMTPIDLSLIQMDATDPVVSGQIWSKQLFLSNLTPTIDTPQTHAYDRALGSGDALTIDIEADAEYVGTGLQTSDFSCEPVDAALVRCHRARGLEAGANDYIELRFRAGSPGIVRSRVTLTAAQTEGRRSNNTDPDSTRIVAP